MKNSLLHLSKKLSFSVYSNVSESAKIRIEESNSILGYGLLNCVRVTNQEIQKLFTSPSLFYTLLIA